MRYRARWSDTRSGDMDIIYCDRTIGTFTPLRDTMSPAELEELLNGGEPDPKTSYSDVEHPWHEAYLDGKEDGIHQAERE